MFIFRGGGACTCMWRPAHLNGAGAERERERENPKQALCHQHRAHGGGGWVGVQLMNREIMT